MLNLILIWQPLVRSEKVEDHERDEDGRWSGNRSGRWEIVEDRDRGRGKGKNKKALILNDGWQCKASYYAHRFHNRTTANGETFNMHELTVAHKTLPFNTILKITNLRNGRVVYARVNDRGPYIEGREVDVSLRVAMELDMVYEGVQQVRVVDCGVVSPALDLEELNESIWKGDRVMGNGESIVSPA